MAFVDFNDLINDYVKREARPSTVGKYSPSMLPYCLRKNYYIFTRPLEFTPEKMKIFALGDMLHDFVEKVLRSNPNVQFVSSERSITLPDLESDLVISGRLDDCIVWKEDSELTVVEIKSTKSIAYRDEAMREHVDQLMFYLRAMNASKGILVYVDKSTLETKQFDVKYDRAHLVRLMERARKLHGYLLKDTLPEAEAKMSKDEAWQCSYCEYKQRCDANEK